MLNYSSKKFHVHSQPLKSASYVHYPSITHFFVVETCLGDCRSTSISSSLLLVSNQAWHSDSCVWQFLVGSCISLWIAYHSLFSKYIILSNGMSLYPSQNLQYHSFTRIDNLYLCTSLRCGILIVKIELLLEIMFVKMADIQK